MSTIKLSIYQFNNTYVISNYESMSQGTYELYKKKGSKYELIEKYNVTLNKYYHLVDSLNNLYIGTIKEEKTKTYTLINPDDNFVENIDEETYTSLIEEFKNKYKTVNKDVIVYEEVSDKVDLTINRDFTGYHKVDESYITSTLNINDKSYTFKQKYIYPNNKYYCDDVIKAYGNYIVEYEELYNLLREITNKSFSTGKLSVGGEYYKKEIIISFDVFERSYNGETIFVRSRKANGAYYADGRGKHFNDYPKTIDNITFPLEFQFINANADENVKYIKNLLLKTTLQLPNKG